MNTQIIRLCIVSLGLAYSATPGAVCAQADKKDKDFHKDLLDKAENEYRLFFKEPKETHEFWSAIEVELSLGKFELAGFFLKKVVEKEPKEQVDKDFLKIQETVGFKPFLRLRDVRQWSPKNMDFDKECRENADKLIKRLSDSIEKTLSDPERIRKYIRLLDAPTQKERDNAFTQLMRSRDKLLPYLLDTIRDGPGTILRQRVIEALSRMDKEMVAPLYEILKAVHEEDFKDTNLRLAVLEVFRLRADMGCIPYLWHMSSSPRYPIEVRNKALATLGYLREQDPGTLPLAKGVLTEMAEKCYQHKLSVDITGKRIWLWDGRNLADEPDVWPKRKAEYFFGLRYAREALELDPNYKPAQIVLLNFFLERTFDQDLDKYFFKPMPPEIHQLLLDLDPELLIYVLERALNDNNVPVMLPLIDILGERGEVRAAQPSLGYKHRGLMRALYYSDRRVQYAAVNALLKMPNRGAPADSIRVVEVLRRFLAAEPAPRTMVAMCPKEQVLKTEKAFELGGFGNVEIRCETLAATFEKLRQSADYDVIFIHPSVKKEELPFVVSQLRGDADQARVPLIVLTAKENQKKYMKMFESHPNTWVELDTFLTLPEALKKLADDKIDLTGGGYKPLVGGWKLSADERKKFSDDAMKFLWQMGKGEIAGYDVREAQDTVRATLHKPDLAKMALETAARNPNRDTQLWLANVFFDPAFAKLKLTTVLELRQHILKNGSYLEKHHVANLKDAEKTAEPEVRAQVTLILANLRVGPKDAGKKLNDFNPPIR